MSTTCPGARAHDPERPDGLADATLAAHDADIMLIANIATHSIDVIATPNVGVADVIAVLQHVARRLLADSLGAN